MCEPVCACMCVYMYLCIFPLLRICTVSFYAAQCAYVCVCVCVYVCVCVCVLCSGIVMDVVGRQMCECVGLSPGETRCEGS